MGEYKWLGDHAEDQPIGGRRLPSAEETDRQVDEDLAKMFANQPDGGVHIQYPGKGKTFAAPRGNSPDWLQRKVADISFDDVAEGVGSLSVISAEGDKDV